MAEVLAIPEKDDELDNCAQVVDCCPNILLEVTIRKGHLAVTDELHELPVDREIHDNLGGGLRKALVARVAHVRKS